MKLIVRISLDMAQGKGKGLQGGPVQKHLHSRISFLYQAATYLANATKDQTTMGGSFRKSEQAEIGSEKYHRSSRIASVSAETESLKAPLEPGELQGEIKSHNNPTARNSALSCQLLNHLRAVSLKSVIRITPVMKHSICRRCDVLLVPGSTAIADMENKSRGGKKSWADVLVVTCVACGTARRIPIGAKRQLKKQYRPIGLRAKREVSRKGI